MIWWYHSSRSSLWQHICRKRVASSKSHLALSELQISDGGSNKSTPVCTLTWQFQPSKSFRKQLHTENLTWLWVNLWVPVEKENTTPSVTLQLTTLTVTPQQELQHFQFDTKQAGKKLHTQNLTWLSVNHWVPCRRRKITTTAASSQTWWFHPSNSFSTLSFETTKHRRKSCTQKILPGSWSTMN